MTHARILHPHHSTQPTQRELAETLKRLYVANAVGHHRLAEGTRGHTEYQTALAAARHALQAYAWGDDSHLPALPSVCNEPPILYAEGEVRP